MVPALPGVPALLDGHRALINPGSVGQPRDGNPQSSYLVLDVDAGQVDYRRVPYDVERAAAAIVASGLPHDFADHLRTGGRAPSAAAADRAGAR